MTDAPERYKDTWRNAVLNKAVDALDRIINDHDPEIHRPIEQGVWDHLDKLVLAFEDRWADLSDAKDARITSLQSNVREMTSKWTQAAAERDAALARAEAAEAERDTLEAVLTGRDHVGSGARLLKRAFARAEAAEAKLAVSEIYVARMAKQNLHVYEADWQEGFFNAVVDARATLAQLKGTGQ